MKKIIAFTFMVLFVTFFALAKEVERPSSAPENSIMFDIGRLNVKDKVKLENGTSKDLIIEVNFYNADTWVTVGKSSLKSNEMSTVMTPYEDKLKKYRDNIWCVIFPDGVNSDDYHLLVMEKRHDLVIQIFEK